MEAREKSEIVFKQKNVRNNKREREKKTITKTEWTIEKDDEDEKKRDP